MIKLLLHEIDLVGIKSDCYIKQQSWVHNFAKTFLLTSSFMSLLLFLSKYLSLTHTVFFCCHISTFNSINAHENILCISKVCFLRSIREIISFFSLLYFFIYIKVDLPNVYSVLQSQALLVLFISKKVALNFNNESSLSSQLVYIQVIQSHFISLNFLFLSSLYPLSILSLFAKMIILFAVKLVHSSEPDTLFFCSL